VWAVAVHSAGDALSSLVVFALGLTVMLAQQSDSDSGSDADDDDYSYFSKNRDDGNGGGGGGSHWTAFLDPVVTIVLSAAMAYAMKGVLAKATAILLEASALGPTAMRELRNDLDADPLLRSNGYATAPGPASLVVTELDFEGTRRRAMVLLCPTGQGGRTGQGGGGSAGGGGGGGVERSGVAAGKAATGPVRRRVRAHLAARGARWTAVEIDD
jgi:hypothetical protein